MSARELKPNTLALSSAPFLTQACVHGVFFWCWRVRVGAPLFFLQILQQWLDFVAAADTRGQNNGQDKTNQVLGGDAKKPPHANDYRPASSRSSGGSGGSDKHSRRAASCAEAGRHARTTLCLELLPPPLRATHAWHLNNLVGVDCERRGVRPTGGNNSSSSGNGSGRHVNGGGAVAEAQRIKDSLVVLYVS